MKFRTQRSHCRTQNLCDYRQKIHKFAVRREAYDDLSSGTRLPFEDFFASTPSAGPQVGDFAQKRLERLLGVGDDGVVFLLFQDLFHRTSEDVHEFYSITSRPESSRVINFAAIIIGGISSLWPHTTILHSIAAARPLQAQGGFFRARQCRRFADRPAPGNQPPF
jgi:hypothetical protein